MSNCPPCSLLVLLPLLLQLPLQLPDLTLHFRNLALQTLPLQTLPLRTLFLLTPEFFDSLLLPPCPPLLFRSL